MIAKIRPWIGWVGVILFVALYGVELLPHHGPPATVRWVRETIGQEGLIAVNVAIVLGFLAFLPYRRPSRHIWKSHGAFAAFVLALMTEMFGIPLVLFLLSPLVELHPIAPEIIERFGHRLPQVGTLVSIIGVVLIALGWQQIHAAQGLVTTGLYRFMRHPQYTGILLFTFGWIVHWPSIITIALWPLVVAMYVWLALKEEQQVRLEFGEAYDAYAQRTKRFIPVVGP